MPASKIAILRSCTCPAVCNGGMKDSVYIAKVAPNLAGSLSWFALRDFEVQCALVGSDYDYYSEDPFPYSLQDP